uniref:ZZ-type domain-containing protein n=1 Tax=Chromera velia CCMP2878 TaxID=1169474 RepID=A0A0G4GEA7_9ALVE|eukprot:Cvel_21511.t1-p1 / transcript=Cvel_21511.t1 / gene=Cvel_21511 / organism=Chromera_velia_CCMP2878 / gene_product=hypothetical protein / transcript_product=hypothetical protein / location=Cvel_scaffold2024:24997-31109(-) / protein_length=757 / sequence_SO=supercontig / SO=protein_coding / is_pseudo=false
MFGHNGHDGVACDSCGEFPIKRNRYLCLQCCNTNFCDECKDQHPRDHSLLLLRDPVHPTWNEFLKTATLAGASANIHSLSQPMPTEFLKEHITRMELLLSLQNRAEGQEAGKKGERNSCREIEHEILCDFWKRNRQRALKPLWPVDPTFFDQFADPPDISGHHIKDTRQSGGPPLRQIPKIFRFTQGPPTGLVLLSEETGFPLCAVHVLSTTPGAPLSVLSKKTLPGVGSTETEPEFLVQGPQDAMKFGFVFTNLCRKSSLHFDLCSFGSDGSRTIDLIDGKSVRGFRSVRIDENSLSIFKLNVSGDASAKDETAAPVTQTEFGYFHLKVTFKPLDKQAGTSAPFQNAKWTLTDLLPIPPPEKVPPPHSRSGGQHTRGGPLFGQVGGAGLFGGGGQQQAQGAGLFGAPSPEESQGCGGVMGCVAVSSIKLGLSVQNAASSAGGGKGREGMREDGSFYSSISASELQERNGQGAFQRDESAISVETAQMGIRMLLKHAKVTSEVGGEGKHRGAEFEGDNIWSWSSCRPQGNSPSVLLRALSKEIQAGRLSSLQHLKLSLPSMSSYSDRPMEILSSAFASAVKPLRLESLDLAGGPVDDVALSFFLRKDILLFLKKLDLGECQLDEYTLGAVADRLKRGEMPLLESLGLNVRRRLFALESIGAVSLALRDVACAVRSSALPSLKSLNLNMLLLSGQDGNVFVSALGSNSAPLLESVDFHLNLSNVSEGTARTLGSGKIRSLRNVLLVLGDRPGVVFLEQ